MGGDGAEDAASYDVGGEDPAELITMECHHERAASGATGDVTGTHVDEGPGRHVGEDRAAGIRRAGLANVATSRVTHEGAHVGAEGPDFAGIGPEAAAVPGGAKRRPSEAETYGARGPDNASAESRQMPKGEAAEAGASALDQDGRKWKKRRNITVHRHRSWRPTERSKAEGMRADYREDGDGAASSTAQAASREYLAAAAGPGSSGITGNRRGAPARDVNTDAGAVTSAAAAAYRGRAEVFETASGRPVSGGAAACERRSIGVSAVERRTLQDGAVDRGRDRAPGDVRRGETARGDERGAEAHARDEDTDARAVRNVSKRGLHASIHAHQGSKARRGTTAGQGDGEGTVTASDHTCSNTRSNLEEAAVGDNPGQVPLRPANWGHMTRDARKGRKQRQRKKRKKS